MNTQTKMLIGALLTSAVAAAAGAATPATPNVANANRCDQLTAQFDSAKASHSNAKDYQKALTERETGAAQCKAGDTAKGTETLARALKDLGVKPVATHS